MNRTKREISTGTVGAITELIVCADLMKKGFEVFRCVSPHSSCDLVAFKSGRIFRIEVKTIYKSSANFHDDILSNEKIEKLRGHAKNCSKILGDTVALGCHTGKVIYFGPIEEIFNS